MISFIKLNTIFRDFCLLSILCLSLNSCEKDFVNIDSTLQGAQNFNSTKQEFSTLAYSKPYGEVQTNGLSSNLLGYFNEPVYGKTLASVVTQVTPASFNPDFGPNPVIKSVELNIPYFSTAKGNANDEGIIPYRLDSIYGDRTAPFKLSIYQNNYLLRDFNPNSNSETQAYYSNAIQELGLDNQLGELLYQDETFTPRNTQIIVDTSDPDNFVRTPPALNIDLMENSGDFWKDLLLDSDGEAVPQLINANNFRAYFRGLTFRAEPLAANTNSFQIMLDYSNATITVNYTNEDQEADDPELSYVLNFSGIRLNAFETDYNFPLPNGDADNGDDKLFVKGGVGSAAIIKLFNDFVEDDNGELIPAEQFFTNKKDDWLINQANLTVYVDQSSLPNTTDGKNEPNRLVLFDLKNNTPIADYFLDVNTVSPNGDQSRTLYAEPLQRDANKKGVKYKFRVTEHLNNILKRDSTNVNLGIYVSTNVNLLLNGNGTALNNSLTFGSTADQDDTTLDNVPSTSVLSPRGTVLFGSTTNVAEELRPKLEIFYTEPKN